MKFDGTTFHWSMEVEKKKQKKKKDQVFASSLCEDELQSSTNNNPYVIKVAEQAYWRVWIRGCCAADASDADSLIGKYGHLERANVWTHLIPCVVLMVFAFARPWILGAETVSDQLSVTSIIFTAITFAVSTVYHTYATVPFWAPGTRTLDHASIALSLSCATIADLCMATKDFTNVDFRAWLDPLAASFVLIVYFGIRRLYVDREDTRRESYTSKDGCSLGLYRFFHSDLEHAALRASGSATLTLTWVLLIPSAFKNLDTDPAVIWVIGASIGTVLLIAGIILDNTAAVDDFLLRTKGEGPCSCSSKALGCVFSTHAIWHVIAVAGASSSIFAREYGIASWK